MAGRLIVCPTPIGNLGDITLRTLEALREADLVACEDTRHTRGLLDRHGIEVRTISYHEHNERSRATDLLERIAAGAVVALVSDAGMPLVSDPGFVVVQAAIAAGVEVEVLPGPSSVLVALVASGLPGEQWHFAGFLPRKGGELRELLSSATATTVAFESPKRIGRTLALLAEIDPARPVAVCRELTKLHEEVVRGAAAELAERFGGGTVKGEIVLVFAGAEQQRAALDTALDALMRLTEAGAKARPAAAVVAELTGLTVNVLYDAHLRRTP